jgi:predicted PurR-regulated permease PerM
MADVVDTGKNYLPLWVQEYIPSNMNEVQTASSEWLRKNAGNLSVIGGDIGIFLIHIIIGMIIGGMIALHHEIRGERGIFAQALGERVEQISQAFRRIVFSQVRISALNTVLTGIFLVLVMPLLGHPLPLTKVMIAVTFVCRIATRHWQSDLQFSYFSDRAERIPNCCCRFTHLPSRYSQT